MERSFFPIEVEARRELARIGLIIKHHYHPQILQFDVLDDPSWQANIEAKQGSFQIDRYRPLLSKVETWYIIHGTTNGTQMLQIILEIIVQVKILITNIISFIH